MVVSDGGKGGGDENNHSCKKEVMKHCCGLEDLDEKTSQTEESLTPCSFKGGVVSR